MSGAYYRMVNYNYYGRDMIIFSEVRGDNAYASAGFSNRFQNVSSFTLTTTHSFPADTWKKIYEVVSSANLAIGANITKGNKADIEQGKAEAFAIRALAHFDLLRLYGQQYVDDAGLKAMGIPYITQFGELNAKKYTRLKVQDVRDLIYKDLDQALTLVNKNASNKKRFSEQSIYGVKSRVALYFASFNEADYAIALESAEKAMNLGGDIIQRSAYIASFRAEEPQSNSVLELAQDNINNPGNNSLYNIYSYDGYGDVVGLGDNLKALFTDKSDIRASEEMQGDLLIKGKVEYYRNFGKYTGISSNIKVMRYEELAFNFIEAAVRSNVNTDKALKLLNKVASERYANLKGDKYTTLTLKDVLAERRKELVFEGFRFEDQMRNKEDLASTPQSKEGIKYKDPKLAFPIPRSEINDSKIDQNAGY